MRNLAAATAAVTCSLPCLLAQTPDPAQATPKPPNYQMLRQNEDWSVLRQTPRVGMDRMKFMPLSQDEAIWLSFGGEARLRGEAWDGFRFGSPATADATDTFLLSRLLLHGDLHLGPNVRAFVQGITAWVTDRELVGGRRATDVDAIDLAQAFVDVRAALVDDYSITLRPGRQQFAFGRQRLVSYLPWANSLRAWDGLAAIVESKAFAATGFATQFVPVQKYGFNDVNRAVDFSGVHASWKPNDARPGLDAYGYLLHRDVATFNGTTGAEQRYTFGGRVWRSPGAGRVDYDAELAWQAGEHAGNDIDAFMAAANLGYTFAGTWTPRAWVGVDYASGDKRSGGNVGTFNQLFPLGHAYFGYIDIIGRQNIVDASAGIELKFTDRIKTALDAHTLWLADRSDALYDAAGGVVRAGGTASSSFVGVELDVTANWQVDRHLGVLGGLSYFAAGSMVEQSGPSEDTLFAYVQASLVF